MAERESVKRGARTESLSLRIDPKTKFVLDFMVRATGFRITDLIERAIKDYADKTTVGGGGDFALEKNWLHYWHPEEGVRTLRMIFDSDIRTTFEEDELAEFVEQHHQFFLSDRTRKTPLTAFVQVLWPKIHDYLDHWRENKAQQRWATGDMMLKAIKSSGMKGPDWPPQAKPSPMEKPAPAATPTPTVSSSRYNDLDDDIPF